VVAALLAADAAGLIIPGPYLLAGGCIVLAGVVYWGTRER
jgi:hypothetical protein